VRTHGESRDDQDTRAVVQAERFADFYQELSPLLYRHWREVACDQDLIPLDPDFEKYLTLERNGMLACQTIRKDGVLAGYFISFVMGHLHYQSTRHAFTDVYFVDRPYRNAFLTLRFFRFVMDDLRARGVKKHYTMRKLHLDPSIGEIWERLGYKPVEVHYTKMLEA
jgi:hypothetical protein